MPNQMTNSHILVNSFTYHDAASVAEAVALLDQYGPEARILAGGTDLIVQMKMERLAPQHVVGIRRIPGLDRILWHGDQLEIGALTTIRGLRRHPVVQAHFPALAAACASFSTTQIQTMGTVGGNLCNGSPASDTAPALLAYGAQLVLVGPDGERTLPLEGFFRGPGKVDIRRGELLVRLLLPAPRGCLTEERSAYGNAELAYGAGVCLEQDAAGQAAHAVAGSTIVTGSAFLKISRVAADLAKASAAVVIEREGTCITGCRLAYGAVAATPPTRPARRVIAARATVQPRAGGPGRGPGCRGDVPYR